MASGTAATTATNSGGRVGGTELCRYFLMNVCRFGDKCAFSHDRATGAQPSNICRFYLQGKCNYGDRCRYDHVRPKATVPMNTSQPLSHSNVPLPALPSQVPTSSHPLFQTRVAPTTAATTNGFSSHSSSSSQHHDLAAAASSSATSSSTSLSKPPRAISSADTLTTTQAAPMSYASVCRGGEVEETQEEQQNGGQLFYPQSSYMLQSLCPYMEKEGTCEALLNGQYCPYLHNAEICDLCQMPCLHPFHQHQREQHRAECLQKHEAECEEAFAAQRSADKKCGVCLETVWEREGDKRFGILENCEHIFCLECIRKWRASSNYENKVVKACPECRVKSDFVTPMKIWPETEEAKKIQIKAYKENLQQIHCKFFKRGEGICPFGSKCFYRHVDKHGHVVQLGPPQHRRRLNARGEMENFSDVLMVSVFSHEDFGRIFDEYDFLFDDEDDDSHSELTDEDEFRFVDEQDVTDDEVDNYMSRFLWQ